MTCSGHNQARNPRAWILPFWSKTDMDSLKQNLCLAPDQKRVGPKKLQMIKKSIWHRKFFWAFFVKKRHNLSSSRITYDFLSSDSFQMPENWLRFEFCRIQFCPASGANSQNVNFLLLFRKIYFFQMVVVNWFLCL